MVLKAFSVPEGESQTRPIGWPNPISVTIDNYSASWLDLRKIANRHVPPYIFGTCLRVNPQVTVMDVAWAAPSGIAANPTAAGGSAELVFYSDPQPVNPGVQLYTPTAAGGNPIPVTQTYPPPPPPGTTFSLQTVSTVTQGNYVGQAYPLPAVIGPAAWTQIMWVKTAQTGSNVTLTILGNNTGYGQWAWIPNLNLMQWAGGGITGGAAVAIPNIADGVTHMLAAVFDGSKCSFYVDGVLQGNSGALVVNITVAAWTLAGENNVTGNPSPYQSFFGSIDEPAIFNYALTAGNIASLYTAGVNAYAVIASLAPVHSWHMDITSGTAIPDVGATPTTLNIGAFPFVYNLAQPPLV